MTCTMGPMSDGQDGDLSIDDLEKVSGEERARRELWALSVAAAGVGTFDWNLTTGRLTWDERLIELFGYTRGEFDESIEAFNTRLHPEDLPDVTARLSTAIETGGDYEATYRVTAPGRPLRWITARGRALQDPDGRTVRVLGAAWDTTTAHEAAAEVAGIVEDLAVGFFAVDHHWHLTHLNAATQTIAGVTRAEALGRSFWEVFPAAVGTAFEQSYRRAVQTREVVTFQAHYPDPIDVWVEVRAVPTASGLSVYFLDISAHHRAAELAASADQRAALLSRITEELLTQDDPDDAAGRLAHLVVPALSDWAIVTLADAGDSPTGRHALRTAAAVHAEPAGQALLDTYATTRLAALTDQAPLMRTLATGTAQFIEGAATPRMLEVLEAGPAREAMAALAPEHLATHPLVGRQGSIGTLTLGRGTGRGGFDDQDRATATHVASRAGIVLDNARLHRQQRNVAVGLQRSLLTPPPEPDHLQIAVRYTASAEAAEVGGDWYDAFITADGTTSLVIGDVTGHDLQAAAAMGQYRNLLRGIGYTIGQPPAAVLTALDHAVAGLGVDTLATVLLAQVEQDEDHRAAGTRLLRWSNAGHLPPLLITAEGTARLLEHESDLLIGIDADSARHDHELVLQPGQTVLLYTDGLVERRGIDVRQGLEWLAHAAAELAGEPLEELCDALLELVGEHPADDIALLGLRAHPEDRPRPAEAGPVVLPAPLAGEGDQRL